MRYPITQYECDYVESLKFKSDAFLILSRDLECSKHCGVDISCEKIEEVYNKFTQSISELRLALRELSEKYSGGIPGDVEFSTCELVTQDD